jgi:CRISPR-associated protein (TIGR03986 family)
MSQISAPYRFVPLSRLVLLPDWAEQVSHDQPFADGLCGELQLTLTTHTPLCVGGEQDKASKEAPGKVHFFRTPDGQLAIPGTSLKGMLRNVLEIASFARFSQVEDQRLGVRDISKSNNFYCKAMVNPLPKAGWLSFSEGQWRIQPCDYSRLHQQELIDHFKLDKASWKRLGKAKDRYAEIGICPEVPFNLDTKQRPNGQSVALPSSNGAFKGRVVVTGQPGKDFESGKSAKKFEFVFYNEIGTRLLIEPNVLSGFRLIHDDTDEFKFWLDKLSKGSLPLGIPVFFHGTGERVTSLGLAMMYKLPYSNSLHDAIRHTHAEHLQNNVPDLPDLLFGYLGEGNLPGLRGRVSIGMATPAQSSDTRTKWTEPCILNGPKPTFYPAYIRQPEKGEFSQLMSDKSELAGWKRYPVKVDYIPRPGEDSASSVQVRLETVASQTKFELCTRFHNLRRVELGALLWAIDFGNRSKLRHALGMGRPFGLGQVELQISGQRLRSNNPADDCIGNEAQFLFACRKEFIDLMDQTMTAAGQNGAWEHSEPIKALLEYALPPCSDADLGYLPKPKDFVDLRDPKLLPELHATFHSHNGISPAKGFETSTPRGYASSFAANLENAATELNRKLEKAADEQRKANASEEDRQLIEVEIRLKACLAGAAGKTDRDKLNDELRQSWDTMMNMDETQQNQLRDYAQQAAVIDDKKIQKICKKLLAGE